MEWQHEVFGFFSNYEAARTSFVIACVLTPLYFLLAPSASCCCAMMQRMRASLPALPRPSLGESPLSMRPSALFSTPRGTVRHSGMPSREDTHMSSTPTDERMRSSQAISPIHTESRTPADLCAQAPSEAASSTPASFLGSPYLTDPIPTPSPAQHTAEYTHSANTTPRGSCDCLYPTPQNDPYYRDLAYHKSSTTRQALDALYTTPAFQSWYQEHRASLMARACLRRQGQRRAQIAMAFALLLAVGVLPAFQLSSTAQQSNFFVSQLQKLSHLLSGRTIGGSSVSSGNWAGQSSAGLSMAQLLAQRAHYIMHERRVSLDGLWSEALYALVSREVWRGSWTVSQLIGEACNYAEVGAMMAALCTLLTSVFMPHGPINVSSLAWISLLILLAEALLVPHTLFRPGMGCIVIVGTLIAHAMCA